MTQQERDDMEWLAGYLRENYRAGWTPSRAFHLITRLDELVARYDAPVPPGPPEVKLSPKFTHEDT